MDNSNDSQERRNSANKSRKEPPQRIQSQNLPKLDTGLRHRTLDNQNELMDEIKEENV